MQKNTGVKYSFTADRLLVIVAYVLAFAGAWISILFFPDKEIWMKIAIGDLVGTVIIFIFSIVTKNSSMYDPYWSVVPPIILVYLIITTGASFLDPRILFVSVVVFYWAIRLTFNWLKTWPGLLHEDWRYKKLAQDTGIFYWPVSFLGIHLFPTIMVFLGCLPLIPIVESAQPLGFFDILGALIALAAIEIERRADNQLRAFKMQAKGGKVCESGLWKYSRHPNYFGEISFWGGIFIIALGLNPGANLIYGIGFLAMIILFVFISIPMMEKRQIQKEGYAAYKKRVWMLVPWFRKS